MSIVTLEPLQSGMLAGMLRAPTAVRKRARARIRLQWQQIFVLYLQAARQSCIALAIPGKSADLSSVAKAALILDAMALPSSTPH